MFQIVPGVHSLIPSAITVAGYKITGSWVDKKHNCVYPGWITENGTRFFVGITDDGKRVKYRPEQVADDGRFPQKVTAALLFEDHTVDTPDFPDADEFYFTGPPAFRLVEDRDEAEEEIKRLRAFIGSFFATDEDRMSALCRAEREGGTDMADAVRRAFEEPST